MHEKYRSHVRDVQLLALKYPDHKLIIMGDFNRPGVTWSNEPLSVNYTTYQSPDNKDINSRLCSLYSSTNSRQMYPTYPDKGYSVDLFFCLTEIITHAEFCDPLVPIDLKNHRAAAFTLDLNVESSLMRDTIKLDFIKGDDDLMQSMLS